MPQCLRGEIIFVISGWVNMKTFLIVTICVVAGFWITSVLLIKNLMEPAAKPLTSEELKSCEKIIKEGKGYPYVCKWALKHGKCPCLPCKKLGNEKSGQQVNK